MWFIHQVCYDELLAIFILGTQGFLHIVFKTVVLHPSYASIAIRYAFILQKTGMAVSTAKGYGLEHLDSISDSAKFYPSPRRPCLTWGPPSLLFKEYRRLFAWG
jgi:hypothetical protein